MRGTSLGTKCVKIKGTDDLVVYGVNKETFTNDGFLGIAEAGLGREYYIVSQYPPTYHCEFGIAAIEDGTVVTIKLPRLGQASGGVSAY